MLRCVPVLAVLAALPLAAIDQPLTDPGQQPLQASPSAVRSALLALADAQKAGDRQASAEADKRLQMASAALAASMRPGDTGEVVKLVELAEASGIAPPAALSEALADRGDGRAAPWFLARLSKAPYWPYREHVGRFFARSDDPRTIRLLIRRLADRRADPEPRRLALLTLPRTGGPAGLRAVLAARDTPRTIPSLAEHMGLDLLGLSPGSRSVGADGAYAHAKLDETRRDDHGVLWGRFTSGILGMDYDQWYARWGGAHWRGVVLVGFEADPRDWVHRWVGNPQYTRDTDGDGWTDILEGRLGTDPTKADTDGDGILDSRDRNPLAGTLPATDEEKALAAAFEGRFLFTADHAQAFLVRMPPGMRPIEFRGSPWVTIHAGSPSHDIRQEPGPHVVVVQFMKAGPSPTDPDGPPLRAGFLPAGATEAEILVDALWDPLGGDRYRVRVRKFGSEWVAVECSFAIAA